MKNIKKKKSQQLVEFLLVAPFMIIVLGILTEYAYALNVNMLLHSGLKEATSSLYGEIRPNNSSGVWSHLEIRSLVLNDLGNYMLSNNAAVTSDNNLDVDYVITGETAVFMAKYTYLTAFTLPNAYFKILPDSFQFCATVPLPAAFLEKNNYDNISSEALDKIWNTNNFSSLGDFNDSKKGIMTNIGSSTSAPASKILFFLPASPSVASLASHKCYFMTKWNGVNLSGSNSAPWIADLTDNKNYKCDTDLTTCTLESSNIANKFAGISSLIFYYGFIGTQTGNTCGANFLDTCWIENTSSKISDTIEDGVLKQALSLTDSSLQISDGKYMNAGNFDNIDVSNYNSGASAGLTYKEHTFGSISILCPDSDLTAITNMLGTSTPPSNTYSDNFGTKVN